MVVLLAIDPSTKETGWAIFSKGPCHQSQDSAEWEKMPDPSSSINPEENAMVHPHWRIMETGVIIAYHRLYRVGVAERIVAIEVELDRMIEKWQPQEVACGKPSLMQFPQQQEGVEMLTHALERWSQGYNISLHCYPLRDIRAAILGRANAAKGELAYAVMTRWGLLGEGKTAHEWNAVAVGDYHLGQRKTAVEP